MLICILVIAESISNYKVIYTSGIASFDLWYSSTYDACKQLNNDKGFYRVNSFYDFSVNSGTLFGYNGVGHFASAENEALCDTLGKLGIYRSPRITMNYGITPVLEMILGTKYTIWGVFENIASEESINARIERNNKILSLGYMIYGDRTDYTLKSTDAFINNNYIISTMTGKDLHPFREIDVGKIYAERKGLNIIKDGDGYSIFVDDNNLDDSIEFHILDEGNKCYAYFYNNPSLRESVTDYFAIEGGVENAISKDGDLRVSYIKEMDKVDNEYTLSIKRVGNIMESHFDDMFFYEYDSNELEKAYNELKQEELYISDYRDGYIHGTIDVRDDKRNLFLTIPYDKGWSATVNGECSEIVPVFDDSFMVICLPKEGKYDIELTYEAEGSKLGIVFTVLSILIYVSHVIVQKEIRKRKALIEGET